MTLTVDRGSRVASLGATEPHSVLTQDDLDNAHVLHEARAGNAKITSVMAKHLSQGSAVRVPGVQAIPAETSSTCLHRACAALGVSVPSWLCRVGDLPDATLLHLQSFAKLAKIHYDYYGVDDARNHVELVAPDSATGSFPYVSFSTAGAGTMRYIGITSLVNFFNAKNTYAFVQFYADTDTASFGADLPNIAPTSLPRDRVSSGGSGFREARDQSISAPESRAGQANVNGGVVRPRRRVVASKSKFNPTGAVARSYNVANGVRFNNLDEIFLDTISRDYAQQILEEVFDAWGVDTDDAEAVKYAEDLVWAFIISTTASNKADYSREFEIPQKKGSIGVSFDVLSRVLSQGHALTRRQFARGVADDMRRYIKEVENIHLLSVLSARVGCDPQMASLAFDGSTHCTGLTSHEQTFTKLLETRNLFEDDSLLADGASSRLMQGMSGGPRSIISR